MAKKNLKDKNWHIGGKFPNEIYELIRVEAFKKKWSLCQYVSQTITEHVLKANRRAKQNANVTKSKRASSSVGESSK